YNPQTLLRKGCSVSCRLNIQHITRNQLQRTFVHHHCSSSWAVIQPTVNTQPADGVNFFPPRELGVVNHFCLSLRSQGKKWGGTVRVHPQDHFTETLRAFISPEATGTTKTSKKCHYCNSS